MNHFNGIGKGRGNGFFFSGMLFLFCTVILWPSGLLAQPPFSGTIFLDPDIITERDHSTFTEIAGAGRGERVMFDRRVNSWVTLNPFLFLAKYEDGLEIEVQVNPEFETVDRALNQASKYAEVIGRLPTSLRKDVDTVWIHQGTNPFGGGNRNLLIHIGQADLYVQSGILEETLVHEASHTSLDAAHAQSEGWKQAQTADGEFISTYARDNPQREDIAETFLLYLALRYRSDRISDDLIATINRTIPNRISYFDGLELNMFPIVEPEPFSVIEFDFDKGNNRLNLGWVSLPNQVYALDISTDLTHWEVWVSDIASEGLKTSVTIDAESEVNPVFFKVRIE